MLELREGRPNMRGWKLKTNEGEVREIGDGRTQGVASVVVVVPSSSRLRPEIAE
jgi:hypothetical protein